MSRHRRSRREKRPGSRRRQMDEKTRELIAVGASVSGHCQPCLAHHVGKSREMGISEEEIREAIRVGNMVEKGAMSAMREFSTEVLEGALVEPEPGCCDSQRPSNGCCS